MADVVGEHRERNHPAVEDVYVHYKIDASK